MNCPSNPDSQFQQGLEQFGIPQFEPLSYDRLRFDFDSPILLLSSLRLKNFKVAGFGKTKVISVETNFTDNEMMATVVTEIPRIFVDGLYKGEGRYTNIRVAPKGRFNVTAGKLLIFKEKLLCFQKLT